VLFAVKRRVKDWLYRDPSSSPQPPSPPRNEEEKGEKEWGFEAGGEAARLKPQDFPLPAPRSGSGEGGRGEGNLAAMPKRASNTSGKNQVAHSVSAVA